VLLGCGEQVLVLAAASPGGEEEGGGEKESRSRSRVEIKMFIITGG